MSNSMGFRGLLSCTASEHIYIHQYNICLLYSSRPELLFTRGWQLPRIFVHLRPESRRIPIIFFLKIFILQFKPQETNLNPPRILRISVKIYIEPLIPLENPQKPVESSESSYTQILSCQPLDYLLILGGTCSFLMTDENRACRQNRPKNNLVRCFFVFLLKLIILLVLSFFKLLI
jgi:hypothetical protein